MINFTHYFEYFNVTLIYSPKLKHISKLLICEMSAVNKFLFSKTCTCEYIFDTKSAEFNNRSPNFNYFLNIPPITQFIHLDNNILTSYSIFEENVIHFYNY